MDLRPVAFHEAGHAVLNAVLDAPASVCIIDHDTGVADSPSFATLPPETHGVILLAGAIAEARVLNTTADRLWLSEAASHDGRAAWHLVIKFCGRTPAARVQTWNYWQARTRQLLAEHWASVEHVADALIDQRNLTGAEVAACINIARTRELARRHLPINA